MSNFSHDFLKFALSRKVLSFGEFKTKAGRLSPYFFNSGSFNTGEDLLKLGEFYAEAILASRLDFDILFGPAYKGISLAVTTAVALARKGRVCKVIYNRKEQKKHGEQGILIGGDIQGKVLIIDDVISAGTSIFESSSIIKRHGGSVVGVCISLDRMERGENQLSALEQVKRLIGVPVFCLANLDDLVSFLEADAKNRQNLERLSNYRSQFGA